MIHLARNVTEKLQSNSFFSWLEFEQTNQCAFRDKRRELGAGLSSDETMTLPKGNLMVLPTGSEKA